jgi:hypothetical protein
VEPLRILFGAAFTVAAAMGCGAAVLRGAVREPGIRFVTGAAILSLAVFGLCCVGWAYPLVFLAVGAAAIAAGWKWSPVFKVPEMPRILALFFLLFLILYFFSAMAPETSPDGAGYHLGIVSQYLRWHGFHPITWDFYALLSEGMEMLFLFAFAFGRHSAAAMVHFAFLLALAWEMLSYGRRAGYPTLAACGALLVFGSPVVGVDGTSAYNDLTVAAIAFTLFYLLRIWDEDRSPRLLAAIGIVAGFGFATKYTAWAGIVYALVVVAWKSRRIKDMAIVAAPAAVLVVPWLVRNWLWVHNPLAPFFNDLFRNPYINYSFEVGYRNELAHYDLTSLWQIPMQVTVHGSLSGLLGPVFLLSPIALLALRRAEGRQLLLAALVFGINYFSNIGTRFLIPMLPFVALAMMLAIGSWPRLAIGVAVAHAALSWPPIISQYALPHAWHLLKVPYREALRMKKQDEYLNSHLIYDDEERMIEQKTAPGSTVFMFRSIPEAYTSRRLLTVWQSTENQISGRILQAASDPQLVPARRIRFTFHEQTLRAIRVMQIAKPGGGVLWTIHELRLFDGARELPRNPAWRLTANPYPWGIQDAFDNSLITLWRSGRQLQLGDTAEVDFHHDERLDTLLIETSSDQPEQGLCVEGEDARRQWTQVADTPLTYTAPVPLGLRRAAAEELKRRGIDYVLAFEDEAETDDMRRDPAKWGVRQVGQTQLTRLFQLP